MITRFSVVLEEAFRAFFMQRIRINAAFRESIRYEQSVSCFSQLRFAKTCLTKMLRTQGLMLLPVFTGRHVKLLIKHFPKQFIIRKTVHLQKLL